MGYKTINPDIWADCHFEEASPMDKLIWFYLMTCPERGVSGIFKVTVKRISDNTGIDRQEIKTALENDKVTNVAYDFVNGVAFLKNGYKYRPPGGNPEIIRKAVMADYRKTQACVQHWEKFCHIYPQYDADFLTLEQPLIKGSPTLEHGLEKALKNSGQPNGCSTLEQPLNNNNHKNNSNNNNKQYARARVTTLPDETVPQINPDPEAAGIWGKCLKIIEAEIKVENYKIWFVPTTPISINHERVVIGVPNRFYTACLENNYEQVIKSALAQVGIKPTPKLEFISKYELIGT